MDIDDEERRTSTNAENQRDGSRPVEHVQDEALSADAIEDLIIESRAAREPTTVPQSSTVQGGRAERSDGSEADPPVILSPPEWTIVPDGRVTLSGTAAPSGRLLFQDWLIPVGECTADEHGHWTITIEHLAGGSHVFVAQSVDHQGKLLAASRPWTIQVLPQQEKTGFLGMRRPFRRRPRADAALAATQPDGASVSELTPEQATEGDHQDSHPSPPKEVHPPVILHPRSASRVGASLTLFGTSSADTLVAVLDGMSPMTAVESDDAGYWTATLNRLAPGTHRLYAWSLADNTTQPLISTPVTVTVGDQAPLVDDTVYRVH